MTTAQTRYPHAVIATDTVILTVREGKLMVLLIKMKKPPYLGAWAAPGGLVGAAESVDTAAKRHLKEWSGVTDVFLEQLMTFGAVGRDPFGRVVSVAYYALVDADTIRLRNDGAAWFDVRVLPKLAYDHREMIAAAVGRVRSKLAYSTIAYSLLPREFTLSDLQAVYETILGNALDKRNFRKKILGIGIVTATEKRTSGLRHRPAALYRFVERKPRYIDLL